MVWLKCRWLTIGAAAGAWFHTVCSCPWDGDRVEMKEAIPSHGAPSCSSDVQHFHLENATLHLKWDLNLEKYWFLSCPWATTGQKQLWKWCRFPFDCRSCVRAGALLPGGPTPTTPDYFGMWWGKAEDWWELTEHTGTLSSLQLLPSNAFPQQNF